MADKAPIPNLKSFDSGVDENGQGMGQASPTDLARPSDLQRHLDGDPSGQAETARLASGHASEGADEQTAAETPAATLKQISDPTLGPKIPAGEAIERATAPLGKPD